MIFGNLGNIAEMMKNIKEMQGNLKKAQDELKDERYEGVAGGVKCVISGEMDIKELKIDPVLVRNGDVKKIEALVLEAVNSAVSEARDMAKEKMKRVTGGISIPGIL